MKRPPCPITEEFYQEAAQAGFSLDQVIFLEKWFSQNEYLDEVKAMNKESSAQVEYVKSCRAAGKEPDPWEPEKTAEWKA